MSAVFFLPVRHKSAAALICFETAARDEMSSLLHVGSLVTVAVQSTKETERYVEGQRNA